MNNAAPPSAETPEVVGAPAAIEAQSAFEEAIIETSMDETPIAVEVNAAPVGQLLAESPVRAVPQSPESLPIQSIQAVSKDSAKPDLVGWVYLALGAAGAIAVFLGLASAAKSLGFKRRLLTS